MKLLWMVCLFCLLPGCGWVSEAGQVAREEVGPRALLTKYEWFKDVASRLDKKLADIQVYQGDLSEIERDYEGTKKVDWPRDAREQVNQWRREVSGIKASYNQLAAEYNAAMSKENWRFCEVGRLPQGATEPLPREFKPYVTE